MKTKRIVVASIFILFVFLCVFPIKNIQGSEESMVPVNDKTNVTERIHVVFYPRDGSGWNNSPYNPSPPPTLFIRGRIPNGGDDPAYIALSPIAKHPTVYLYDANKNWAYNIASGKELKPYG